MYVSVSGVVAVMVVVPAPTRVTSPVEASTVATLVSELAYVAAASVALVSVGAVNVPLRSTVNFVSSPNERPAASLPGTTS